MKTGSSEDRQMPGRVRWYFWRSSQPQGKLSTDFPAQRRVSASTRPCQRLTSVSFQADRLIHYDRSRCSPDIIYARHRDFVQRSVKFPPSVRHVDSGAIPTNHGLLRLSMDTQITTTSSGLVHEGSCLQQFVRRLTRQPVSP